MLWLSGRISAWDVEGPRFNPQLVLLKGLEVGDMKDLYVRLWRATASLIRQY